MKALAFILASLLAGCVAEDDIPKVSLPTSTMIVLEPTERPELVNIPLDVNWGGRDTLVMRLDVVLDGATMDSDIEMLTGPTLILEKGKSLAIQFYVQPDNLYEESEYIRFSISSDERVDFGIDVMDVEIVSANAAPTIGFASSQVVMTEGSQSQNVFLTVNNPSEASSVQASFSVSGTASEGQDADFSISTTRVNIGAGETAGLISIDVHDDIVREGEETIILTLQTADTAQILSDSDSMTISIASDVLLNDTGLIQFATQSGFSDQSDGFYIGQDAELGRDTIAALSGDYDGHKSFSFTRIDSSGNATDGIHRCVQDEVSGLVWEDKQEDSTIPSPGGESFKKFLTEVVRLSKLDPDHNDYQPYPYHSQHRLWRSRSYGYYWFNDDNTLNGGAPGTEGNVMPLAAYPMQGVCAYPNENQTNYSTLTTHCNSKIYIEFANSLALCGFKDWRLPTIEELRSVVNFNPADPAFDSDFFTNVPVNDILSSTPSADADGSVWCLNTTTKKAQLCNKQLPHSIMLVREVAP